MNIDLQKLQTLGYKKMNGEIYAKKENDFFTKIIQVAHGTNIVVSRYLKTSTLSIVKSEQIKELIKFYKELKEDYEQCKYQTKELLTSEDKNYLNVVLSQCKENVLYITMCTRIDKRMLRVRYNIGNYYSYIPCEKGFENLKEKRDYTLKELGIL